MHVGYAVHTVNSSAVGGAGVWMTLKMAKGLGQNVLNPGIRFAS